MFRRPVLLFGVLLAAVVVPYVLLDENLAKNARAAYGQLFGSDDPKGENSHLSEPQSVAGRPPAIATPTPPIEQIFRFDITPQWVTSHWTRVSTVAGGPQQLGMRVALVSGTRPDDVAGSLTYYFNEHHGLERVTLIGLTADPRRLLAAVVTPYGLKSQPTTDAARYIAGDPRRPTSEVIVRHLPLVAASSNAPRAEVAVDLRRADARSRFDRAGGEPEPTLLPSAYRRW
jgi:uncharacterized protein DUF6690